MAMHMDAVIAMVIYFGVLVIIGLWANRVTAAKKVTSGSQWISEYVVAGRNFGWLVIGFAMVTTIYSAGTFVGAPGLAWKGGYIWPFTVSFQNLAGMLPLAIVGIRYAILGRKLNFVSYLDFYKERFDSKAITLIGGITIVFLLIPLMTAQFAAGARIFETFTGVPYKGGILIMILLVGFYTIVGGYRAVAYTDVIQGSVMTIGAIILWGALFKVSGGLTAINTTLMNTHPENLTMSSMPIAILGIWCFAIWVIAAPQTVWKCTTYKTSKDMYMAVILSIIIVTIFSTTFQLWGVFGRALLPNLDAPDKVVPALILKLIPGGLAGILIVAPAAALMSTVDSALLISSATVIKDLYGTFSTRAKELSVDQYKKVTYAISAIIVAFVIWGAIAPPKFLEYFIMYALGGLGAVFWWPFVLGLYWKRANKYGTLTCMITSFVFFVIDYQFLHLFGLHAAITTWFFSGIIAIVVTLLTPKPPEEIIKKFWEKY